MDDLISREAAIDAIEQYDFVYPKYMERFVIELRDAIKADLKDDIEELPSAQPKWIPCSERMPEERINEKTQDFEYILCSTTFGDVRPYKFGTARGENEPHFFGIFGGTIDDLVVAWMYLPEAYVPVEETVEEIPETVEETTVLLGDAVEKLDKAISEYNAAMSKSLTKWCNKITIELLKAAKKLEEER